MMVKAMRAVVALVVGLVALVGCVPAYAIDGSAAASGGWVLASTGAPVDTSGTPACESEDQEYGPCLWDARSMGNGSGESFLVEEDGSVSYLRWRDGREVAFPGWQWVGTVDAVDAAGLPACADVRGEVTCERDGRYVLSVDSRACTQTITTVEGEQYIPGPAVADALSKACNERHKDAVGHENQAGLTGTTTPSSSSMEGVHSTASSAAVDEPVDNPTSASNEKVVGSVDSGVRDGVRLDRDREVLVAAAVMVAVGLAVAVRVGRRADRRRVMRRGLR